EDFDAVTASEIAAEVTGGSLAPECLAALAGVRAVSEHRGAVGGGADLELVGRSECADANPAIAIDHEAVGAHAFVVDGERAATGERGWPGRQERVVTRIGKRRRERERRARNAWVVESKRLIREPQIGRIVDPDPAAAFVHD